jgi:hypothetical protein
MTVPAGIRMGANATASYNSSGTYNSPTWVNISTARDVTAGHSFDSADASRKGSGGAKQQEPTLFDLDISLEVLEVPNDTTGFVYLRNAYFSKTVLDFAVCTGAMTASGGELYTRADYKAFSMEQSQPVDGIDTWKFTLKPCYSTNPIVEGTT